MRSQFPGPLPARGSTTIDTRVATPGRLWVATAAMVIVLAGGALSRAAPPPSRAEHPPGCESL